jgi:hypothetical protein
MSCKGFVRQIAKAADFSVLLLLFLGTAHVLSAQSLAPKELPLIPRVILTLSPRVATVTSGGTLQFTAMVFNAADTAVLWSSSGGTISRDGLFSAPEVTSQQTVTVVATSADRTSRGSAIVIVTPLQKLQITTLQLPTAQTSASYSATLTAEGGRTPYQWSLQSGSLPRGLELNASTGTISGSTSQSGAFTFTVALHDGAGQQSTASLAVTVTPASSSNFDGPAELPRVYLQTALADTPAPGKTIQVASSAELQTSLDAANCGDTLLLRAGATFSRAFTFPRKPCDDAHWIIVRTSAPDASLPPEGTRISPCYAGVSSLPGRPDFNCKSTQNVMARLSLSTATSNGPVVFASGANHYRLIGLEITRAPGVGSVSDLITPAANASADHIIVDRVWAHGTAQDETARGVYLGGVTSAAVIDSFFSDFHCVAQTGNCTDSQAVAGGLGNLPSGPFKITNNFMEAAGENILFGGGEATTVPSDIEIRRNHLFKPLIWMPGAAGFVGGHDGNPFIVKNHFELKNAQRVLFEGNVAEYTWGGFSQQGYSLLLTPKNQAGSKAGDNLCPACMVTDVTIRYSKVSHAAAGMQLATVYSDHLGEGSGGWGYSVHDVTFDDIVSETYRGGGALFLISNNWTAKGLKNVSIDHVTGFGDPHHPLLYVGDFTGLPKISAVTITNNILLAGAYPVWSTGGATNCAIHDIPLETFDACFSSYTFLNNVLIATSSNYPPSKWPSGNFFPASPQAVRFADYSNANGGDYRLLPSSTYDTAGTDGRSLGADIDLIEAAIAGVQ